MRPFLLALLLSLVPSALHAQCERMFPDGTRYALRRMSWSPLAYDWDRDTRPDLLFAMRGSTELSAMFNRADGFHPGTALGLSHVLEQLHLADVDGNGTKDILALGPTGISAIFRDGNSAARIVITQPPALELYPQRRAGLGDVNGDGNLDIVAFRQSTLHVLAGAGDGTFTKLSSTPMPNRIINVAVGELTGDTKADVVLVDLQRAVRMQSNGDGTFGTPVVLSATGQERNAAVADFDGDTRADIITFGNVANARGVYLSSKNYAAPLPHALISYTSIEDLDGDAKLDIARGLILHRGAGDGTFTEAWRGAGVVFGMASADFDRDGIGDLATTTLFNDVSIRYGTGPMTYDAPLAFRASDQRQLQTGDFNGDGRMDVLATGSLVELYLANAEGSLTRAYSFFANSARSATFGDFNNDKQLDVFTRDGTYLGVAGGTLQTTPVRPEPNTFGLTFASAGDVDGDGNQDVIGLQNTSAEAIVLLRGDGTGLFPSAKTTETIPVHEPHAISVADFDKDGLTDALTAGTEPGGSFTVRLSLGVRGGTFASPLLIASGVSETATTTRSLAHGDVDGDGRLDFVIPDQAKRAILLFRGLGNATFAAPQRVPIDGAYDPRSDFLALSIAEVTGDGRADIIASGESFDENTTVYAQQADGTFVLWQRLYYGSRLHDVAAADVNGDGATDLVIGDGDSVVVHLPACREALRTIPPVVRMTVSPTKVFDTNTLVFDVTLDTPQAEGRIFLIDGDLESEMPPVIGEGNVSNGRASISVSNLARGTHRVTAIYTGQGRYARAIALPVEIIVSQTPAPGPRRRGTRK